MTRSPTGSVGEGAASRRRRLLGQAGQGLLPRPPVLLVLLFGVLATVATAAAGKGLSAGFVRPTTPAAGCVWRRTCAAGIAPRTPQLGGGVGVVWGQRPQAQGEEGGLQGDQEGKRWRRRRGQAAALLEAPQRYGSQDWIENLKSLLVSRIAKRISGHLIFNTGALRRLGLVCFAGPQ